jgi:phage-related protein
MTHHDFHIVVQKNMQNLSPKRLTMQVTKEQCLSLAKHLIERDGWLQYAYRNPKGCRCISAALADACEELGVKKNYEFYMDVRNSVMQKIGIEFGLAGWNDKKQRTKEEVLEALTP